LLKSGQASILEYLKHADDYGIKVEGVDTGF